MRRQWVGIVGLLGSLTLVQGLVWAEEAAPTGTMEERLKAVEEAVTSPVMGFLKGTFPKGVKVERGKYA